MFSQVSVRPHLQGGYPLPGQDGGGGGTPFPGLDREGTPLPGLDGGVPHPRSGRGVLPSQVRMGRGISRTGWSTLTGTGWRTSHPGLDGSTPCPGLDGIPPSRSGWGTAPPPIRRQSSIVSTYYMAGGMPLAFMREDFLVLLFIFAVSRLQ